MHKCKSIVVTCMDFRLQKFIENWTNSSIGKGEYDRLSVAGAVKNLTFVLDQVELSFKLHYIREVHLINHEDCGAYGKEGNFEKHKEDLLLAKKRIISKYPKLKVFIYYLKLNGEFMTVE